MNKGTVISIALLVMAFGGLILYSAVNTNSGKINLDQYDHTNVISEVNEDVNGGIAEHVRGKEDSNVVFIEYADFQCSGCATAMPTIESIYEEYKDRVAFVFRNFPIQGHQNARAAAAAAESAGFQGYYWEMMSAIFSNRSSWGNEDGSSRTEAFANIFSNIAEDGDVEKFKNDMNDARITKKIDFDYELGRTKHKVEATPSLYIGDTLINIEDARTQDDLKKTITAELDKALEAAE